MGKIKQYIEIDFCRPLPELASSASGIATEAGLAAGGHNFVW